MKLILILFILVFSVSLYAFGDDGFGDKGMLIEEVDGAPSQYAGEIDTWQFPNGSLTYTAGTMTVSFASFYAPIDADYLVGTTNGTLTNEIVVGITPGGQLGGTWASPTIDDLFVLNTGDNMTGDLSLSGTGPDIAWTVTGGDTFGIHAETDLWYGKNDTDSKFYWLVDSNHYLNLVPMQTDGRVGINQGLGSPSYNLDVTGTGRFTSTLKIGAYTLPATDGTNGQQLTTDGAGNITFGSASGVTVTDTTTINLTLTGSDITADGLYTAGDDITLTGADFDVDSTVTRDTEWDTEGEVQTAWGAVNILLETEIDASSELLALMDDETGTGLLTFATSPTFTTDITTPKISSVGNLTIDAVNAGGTSTVYVLNSGAGQVANLDVEGDLTVTDISVVTGGTLQLGADGTDGLLKIYSEQGVTDYIASIYSHTAMTSAASFYLPADEPAGTYLLNMTTGGVIGYDSSTYLTSEVDGSITNELPIAGNLVDISGSPASTVDVDLTEAESVTWGAGAAATVAHTFANSGTDYTMTYSTDLLTTSGSLTLTTGKLFKIGTTQWNSADSIDGTKVANADLGDIGVSSGVWSVEDSSHAHSAATITEADPLALLTAGTDNVKDTHIDWGIGAGQVSGADITFAEGDMTDSTIVSADIKNGTIVTGDLSGTAGVTLAQTAMTAGRSLTISTNDVAADSELFTDWKAMVIETPTDADNFFFFEASVALTVTRVQAIVESATSAVITLQECDSAGDNAVTIEGVTADVDGVISTAIDNAAIDAGDIIRVDVGTVTGTVGQVSVTMTFTKDD